MDETVRSTLNALLVSTLVVAGAAALHWVLGSMSKGARTHPTREPAPNPRNSHPYVPIVLLSLQTLLWMSVVYYILGLFPLTALWRHKLVVFLDMVFTKEMFTVGKMDYSLLSLLILLSVLIGLWLFTSAVAHLIRSRVLHGLETPRSSHNAAAILVQYGLMFLGTVIALQIWGVDLGSLAIVAGVFGVGIGFGLQNITSNFVSGLIILFERPVKIGDFIKVGDLVGTVKRVGLRSTEVFTTDNVSIIVPNSRFIENDVVNWSHGDPVSRIHLAVGVGYGADLRRVRKVLLEAVRRHPDILHHPQPEVWMKGFGDSSIDLNVFVWITDPRKQFRIMSDLYYSVEEELRQKGIEIPYPQRDLHLKSAKLEEALSIWTDLHGLQAGEPHQVDGQAIRNDDFGATGGPETRHASLLEPASESEWLDTEALVHQMRGPGGVEIGDRRYRMNTYAKSFVGSEAVDWLVQTQKATREAAVKIGQLLLAKGVIHHVLDQHPFKDGYYFYRFSVDEEEAERLERPRSGVTRKFFG